MRRSLRILVASAWLHVLGGCLPDLSLPPTAQVTCTSNADCPPGWQCRTNVSRCVSGDAPAGTAASIVGTPLVEPKFLRSGTVTVTFVVDKVLASSPAVSAQGPTGDAIAATVTAVPEVERTWRAELTIPSDALEQLYALRVSLLGADGLEALVSLGQFEVDRSPPPPPRADRILATFEPSDPLDPGSPYQVRLRGTAGAVTVTGEVRLYVLGADEGGATPAAVRTVDAEKGFAEAVVVVPGSVAESQLAALTLRLVDEAGNTSDATVITEPPGKRRMYVLSQDSQIGTVEGIALRPGATYRLGSRGPEGKVAYLVRDVNGERTIELPEGPAEGAVTIPAQEGLALVSLAQRSEIEGLVGLGSGSAVVTRSRVYDVDGTPPVLHAEKVTVTTGFDGVRIRGLAGAVTDRLGSVARPDLGVLCFAVLSPLPGGQLQYCNRGGTGSVVAAAPDFEIAADGSFGPATAPTLPVDGGLYLIDPAGYAVKVEAVPESDGVPPTIEQLTADPPVVKQGEPVRFTFIAGDAQSALPESPRVTFGGVIATRVSGALPEAGGTSSFAYSATVADPVLLGPVEAMVSVIDSGTIARHARLDVVIDGAAPVVSIDGFSGNDRAPGVSGFVTDDTGVVLVEWSGKRVADGFGWNGTTFAAGETWHPVLTDGAFRLGPEVLPPSGTPLEFKVRATDRASRVSAPEVRTLTLGGTNPAPVRVRATTLGERSVRVDWETPPGATPASGRVSFRPEGTLGWTGASAQQGASPVTVAAGTSSLSLTNLSRGRWEFAVEAVRDNVVSERSPVVAAASPAWVEVSGPEDETVIGVAGSDALLLAVTEATEASPSRIYRRVAGGEWDHVHTMPGVTGVNDVQLATVQDLGFWYVAVLRMGEPTRHESVFSDDGGLTWSDAGGTGRVPSLALAGCRFAGDDRQVLTDLLDPATFSGATPSAPWQRVDNRQVPNPGAPACLPNGVVRQEFQGQLRSADRGGSFASFAYDDAAVRPVAAIATASGEGAHVLLSSQGVLYRSTDGLMTYTSLEATPPAVVFAATASGAFVFNVEPTIPGIYVPWSGPRVDRLDLRAPRFVLSGLREGLVLLDTAQPALLSCNGDCTAPVAFQTLPFGIPAGLGLNALGRRLVATESRDGLTLRLDGSFAVYGPLP